jgi:hypothetical protein
MNTAKARVTLKKIERALKTYIALRGTPPPTLAELAQNGSLEQGDLSDPWGNSYQFVVRQDKFSLFSTGPDAYLASDNIYLNAVPPPAKAK